VDVRAGDIVFSYVNQTICAISVAQTSAYDSTRPLEFTAQELWKQDGRQIDTIYEDVYSPLAIPPIASELMEHLPEHYSPLTRNGTGNQGYLFSLPDRAGRLLLSKIGSIDPAGQRLDGGERLAIRAIRRSNLDQTEKEAIIKSRIGQGRFREDLDNLWNSSCAITGVTVRSLLRASHIKPWASSDNRERLDPFNGLLLCAQYYAAFDDGLISFDSTGAIIQSPLIDPEEWDRAHIDRSVKLRSVNSKQAKYLEHHREQIFRDK
jgi:hypothetical protein